MKKFSANQELKELPQSDKGQLKKSNTILYG